MVLSGWTQATAAEKNGESSATNGASTSGAPQSSTAVPEDDDDDMQIIMPNLTGKKRKSSDIAGAASLNVSPASNEPKIKRKAEDIDGKKDLVMLDESKKEGEA